MRIISLGYTTTASYDDPEAWLDRIDFYTGILEKLALRHEVESIEQINYEGQLERRGVRYHFINRSGSRYAHFRKLHRFVERTRPDVVLVNGFIFPLQIILLRRRLGRDARIIVFHRSERPFTGIRRYAQRLADRCVNAYLFASPEFAKQWKHNIDTKKKVFEVVQASSRFMPIDRNEARRVTGMEGAPVFLWVGRLVARKDPLTVLKAFLQFVKENTGARLYMIYQSEQMINDVKAMIAAAGKTGECVMLVGSVPHDQLLYWYNSADFFLIASAYEGSGISLTEALSCGCIPIVSDFVSFRAMTGNGRCGRMFPMGDAEGLLRIMQSISTFDIGAERSRALQCFREELSFDAIAQKLERIIQPNGITQHE